MQDLFFALITINAANERNKFNHRQFPTGRNGIRALFWKKRIPAGKIECMKNDCAGRNDPARIARPRPRARASFGF